MLFIRTILACLINFVQIILINVSCFVFWYNEVAAFFYLLLYFVKLKLFILWVYVVVVLNMWTESLTHSSLGFCPWAWRLPFDGQDCLLTLMWSLSLKQVSAVAIHRSAHWTQTGQGQLCFPLENCITQRKGMKFSRTLWHKVRSTSRSNRLKLGLFIDSKYENQKHV